jgi:chromosome condensin MukBEF complex kleisin-like MukF subunit
MSSPGDNMAQTEPEIPEEFLIECKNCEHPRANHFDRAGCTVDEAINLHAAHNAYSRCHCTNFEKVKE